MDRLDDAEGTGDGAARVNAQHVGAGADPRDREVKPRRGEARAEQRRDVGTRESVAALADEDTGRRAVVGEDVEVHRIDAGAAWRSCVERPAADLEGRGEYEAVSRRVEIDEGIAD